MPVASGILARGPPAAVPVGMQIIAVELVEVSALVFWMIAQHEVAVVQPTAVVQTARSATLDIVRRVFYLKVINKFEQFVK